MKILKNILTKSRASMAKNILTENTWLINQIEKIKSKAGPRYSPDLNVDLPIAEIFDGITRSTNFYATVRTHFGNLIRELRYVKSKYNNKEIETAYKSFKLEIDILANLLRQIREYDTLPIPWGNIEKSARRAIELSHDLADKLRSEKLKLEKEKESEQQHNDIKPNAGDFGSDIHFVYEVQTELRYFEELSTGTMAQLANNPLLLLTGVAGTGKTHLLCDVVKNRSTKDNPLPTVLVFGEYFVPGKDIFIQIVDQTALQLTGERLLQVLDREGKSRNCRALLIIDAINETRIRNFWKKNLNKMIAEIRKYPNIALVVSVRTGFEKEVITKKMKKTFIREDHPGFQFREWEAVNKFFHEFNLPLPEIPLLMPEFQNPLFLLLFCKAFQNRNKKIGKLNSKQIFRGHEGATYIFESFVDSVSKKITKQFGISSSGNNNIWDRVIEKVAEEMVNRNDERVSEDQIITIIQNAYPSIDSKRFIQELERNLLIVKVPKYSTEKKDYDGFDFRFPFQKFSDHLIGRYLFKKYEGEFGKANKNLQTARRFFSRRRKLGKYLFNSWNIGIVEALSIQCPEHLNGSEFIEAAPYLRNKTIALNAFVESIIWRKPTAFSQDLNSTRDYINSIVIRTESGRNDFLNALLSVAPIPNHPFNADFLHRHLSRFSLADRDSWWSTFLHYQQGERGAVDRLVEWSWSTQDKTHLNDESIRLCCVALVWFLTTPNRFLRDKSTKALVALLTDRVNVVLDILKMFKDVNDPYVSERVYAVSYGVALRSRRDKSALKLLAQWIYKTLFADNKPPIHVLIRDYARGVIEVAEDAGIKLRISEKKLTPPFGSQWPQRIPTEKMLRKKYYPEDFFKDKTQNRGFLDIWSSVMHDSGSLGDFGNYVLNSAVNHWSGRRLNSNDLNREQLLEDFKIALTSKQQELLEKATNPHFGIDFSDLMKSITVRYKEFETVEELQEQQKEHRKEQRNEMAKTLQEFELSLPTKKRLFFNKEIKPFIGDRGSIRDPLERFDTASAQRWVFNRVVKLGWKHELHSRFDDLVKNNRAGRSDHKAERIGKKYQWIALYELLARIADNFELKLDSWSQEIGKYEGSWQVGVRDIDPSCILKDIPNPPPNDVPIFENYKKSKHYDAWAKRSSNSAWLKKKNDLPNPQEIIETTDSHGNQWIALEGFVEWQEETPPEQKKYDVPTRTLWYITKSYLVKKKDKAKTFTWAKKQNFMGRWMPESHEFYEVYMAEYPWSSAFLYHYTPYYNHDGWTDAARGQERIPSKILVTDDEYLSSGSSIDCSTAESIRVKLPAKFIVDEMNLKQPYVDGRFFDSSGDLVAFDPGLFSLDLPRHVFIRKDKFSAFLKSNGYSIIWTLLGEKNLIGGGGIGQPLGWLEINGAYILSGNNISGSFRTSFLKSRK